MLAKNSAMCAELKPLRSSSVDGPQLGQVVVVVERRAPLPARRIEQAAFAIGANVAGTDSRDPRQLVQSVLSQPGTDRTRAATSHAHTVNRTGSSEA